MAVRSLLPKLARLEGVRGPSEPVLGTVIAHAGPGRLIIELDDGQPPVSARVPKSYPEHELREAAAARLDAVLVFGRGQRAQAVVIALLAAEGGDSAAESGQGDANAPFEAVVDGRRVRIVAEDEITLRCGRASITLRRDGRVVVRGTHVETDSEGVNRIKGGMVKIN